MRTTFRRFTRCVTTRHCCLPLGVVVAVAVIVALTPGAALAQAVGTTPVELQNRTHTPQPARPFH